MSQEKIKRQIEVPGPWRFRLAEFLESRRLNKMAEVTSAGVELVPMHGKAMGIANHRSDKDDVSAVGYAIRKRRTPFYPAKKELDHGIKGMVLEGAGALFFVREDPAEQRRIHNVMDWHAKAGHMCLVMVERTSKNRGRILGETTRSPLSIALDNEMHELLLFGIGGTEVPPGQHPTKIHVEIGSLSLAEVAAPYWAAEKKVPSPVVKEFHHDVVVPGLQAIVDIAWTKAA